MSPRGFAIIDPSKKERSATAFVADRRLGLTADRTRVVDYCSTEAAFNFRAPGKPVTVEEAERYGISAANPFSPVPGAAPTSEAKAEPKPEDKAAAKPANKGGLRRGKGE